LTQQTFWVTDELDNSFDYLEKAVLFLQYSEKDIWAWKWVSIALHGALYGFVVCMAKGNVAEIRKYTNKNWLENFDLVFELCQNDIWMSQFPGTKPLPVSTAQKAAVEAIKKMLRSGFEQFKPYPSDIKTTKMPDICIEYFSLIKFLIGESGTFTPRWEEKQIYRAVSLCDVGIRLAATSRYSPADPSPGE
jgi:hypothetical protein